MIGRIARAKVGHCQAPSKHNALAFAGALCFGRVTFLIKLMLVVIKDTLSVMSTNDECIPPL